MIRTFNRLRVNVLYIIIETHTLRPTYVCHSLNFKAAFIVENKLSYHFARFQNILNTANLSIFLTSRLWQKPYCSMRYLWPMKLSFALNWKLTSSALPMDSNEFPASTSASELCKEGYIKNSCIVSLYYSLYLKPEVNILIMLINRKSWSLIIKQTN